MIDNKNIQKFLDAIDNMPTIPSIVIEITELAKNPEATAQEVVEIVQYDQAITANCLKVSNSAMFGARQKISNLKDAVVYLGFKNLVKIVLVSSSLDVFKIESTGYGMRKGELWRHSVASAIFSQLISSKHKVTNESTLFTASLLHDIGKLALDSFIGDSVIHIMELMEQGFTEFEAEKKILGIDHARIGGLIAKRWQFPSDLVNAIQHHHTVQKNDGIDFLVRASNVMANIACGNHDGVITTVDADVLDQLKFTQEDLEDIIKEFPIEMKKASDLLNL